MQSDCWFRLEVASPSKYAMAQAQPCSQLLHLNAFLRMCLLHGFPLKMLFALYLPSFSLVQALQNTTRNFDLGRIESYKERKIENEDIELRQ